MSCLCFHQLKVMTTDSVLSLNARTLHSDSFDKHSKCIYLVTDSCSVELRCFWCAVYKLAYLLTFLNKAFTQITRAVTTLKKAKAFFDPFEKVVYGLSSISMICVQNGPLNCKNSSPECTKNRYSETKNGKSAHPTPSAPLAPPLTPAVLDHWAPPRFWKSGYGPDNEVFSRLVNCTTVWDEWTNTYSCPSGIIYQHSRQGTRYICNKTYMNLWL